MLAMLVGLRSFEPSGVDPLIPSTVAPLGGGEPPGVLAHVAVGLRLLGDGRGDGGRLGFGEPGVDRDVTVGGWVGVALAPAILSALALIAVAGYQGAKEAARADEVPRAGRMSIEELPGSGSSRSIVPSGLDAPPFTFRAVANGGFGRWIGGGMLLTFGLASLAPAVYSSFVVRPAIQDASGRESRAWHLDDDGDVHGLAPDRRQLVRPDRARLQPPGSRPSHPWQAPSRPTTGSHRAGSGPALGRGSTPPA